MVHGFGCWCVADAAEVLRLTLIILCGCADADAVDDGMMRTRCG